jgi:hypothetical protein
VFFSLRSKFKRLINHLLLPPTILKVHSELGKKMTSDSRQMLQFFWVPAGWSLLTGRLYSTLTFKNIFEQITNLLHFYFLLVLLT